MGVCVLALPRGNSLIFFRSLRTPPLKSQKNHIQNHKITRKITYRKHQKSQITEKQGRIQTDATDANASVSPT